MSSRPDAMTVVRVPIADLRPDPINPRLMRSHEGEALKRSLSEYGAVEPAVVNADGTIIGGHMRIAAALELGWTDFPVVYVDLPEGRARALNLALNRISGEWDEDKLAQMLYELGGDDGGELVLTGFSEAETERLIASVAGPAEDPPAPEPPEDPVTKPGDRWTLGDHVLICGSAQDPDVLAALLERAGGTPGLVATDPPYGVALDPGWRDEVGANVSPAQKVKVGLTRKVQTGGGDIIPGREGDMTGDDEAIDWTETWATIGAPVIYLWHGGLLAAQTAAQLTGANYELRSQIIWVKPQAPMSRGTYHWQHEPCWFAVRRGATASYRGDRKQTTVWQEASPIEIFSAHDDPDDVATRHPTQKPVSLFERPIRHHLKRGEVVCDPFVGSGTTVVAAERSERRAVVCEIEPAWCDVVVERWQGQTGRKARRKAAA